MELTQEMLDQFKTTIIETVAEEVKKNAAPAELPEEVAREQAENRELLIKQGEAIQAIGEALKKSKEDHDATRDAVDKIADTTGHLVKFVGADGSKKSLEEEDKPVVKAADTVSDDEALESALQSVLPEKYGGNGSGQLTLS